MVFNVRCFKCGAQDVRLVMGGRAILHARCHSCQSNLLAEIMALEEEVENAKAEAQAPVHDSLNEESDFFDENPTTRSIPAMPDLPDLADLDIDPIGAE